MQFQYETQKIEYKRPHLEDFPGVCSILTNREVMVYVSTGARSPSAAHSEFKDWMAHWEKYGYGTFLIFDKSTETVIGFAKVYWSDRSPNLQIGYTLDKPYWRQGLGAAAAEFALKTGFLELNEPRLDAYAQLENKVSRRILEKIGMQCQTENFNYANRIYARYSLSQQKYLSDREICRAS